MSDSSIQQDKELLAEVDAELSGFVMWVDSTPDGSEPTELEGFIRSFQDGDDMWKRLVSEVAAFVKARDKELERKAKIDVLYVLLGRGTGTSTHGKIAAEMIDELEELSS